MKQYQKPVVCSTLARWPFYVASAVLLVVACSIWHVAYVWDKPYFPSWQLITTVSLMLLSSGVFLVWPHALTARLQVLRDLPDSIRELESILADADSVLRSYGKARIAIEALRETVESERTAFEEMRQTVLQGLMDFKQKDMELQESRRESERISAEIEAWRRTAVDYLDYFQRSLECYPDDDPRRSVVIKAAQTYGKLLSPRSVEVIAPAPGDPFVDEVHQAEKEEESSEITPGCILRCEEWGYRLGSDVARSARVVLAKAPAGQEQKTEVNGR